MCKTIINQYNVVCDHIHHAQHGWLLCPTHPSVLQMSVVEETASLSQSSVPVCSLLFLGTELATSDVKPVFNDSCARCHCGYGQPYYKMPTAYVRAALKHAQEQHSHAFFQLSLKTKPVYRPPW